MVDVPSVIRTPAAHTFFLSSRKLQPHCHALTPRTRVVQAQHEAHLCVSPKKMFSSPLAMSYTAPLTTPGTCTPSLSLTQSSSPTSHPLSQRASTLCRSTTSSEWRFGRAPKMSSSLNTRILLNTRIYVSNPCSSTEHSVDLRFC